MISTSTNKGILITTQDRFEDYEIVETLGLVRGNTIRARHIGHDMMASLRMLVGGEVSEYTKMLAESREQAIDRMIAEARRLGADGIVAVRLTTSAVAQGSAELLAYGTAVRLKPLKKKTTTSSVKVRDVSGQGEKELGRRFRTPVRS